MKIFFDMKITKNLHITLFSGGYFSWKRFKFGLYGPMIEMSADEILSKRSAVEILICMESVVERDADGTPFDQRESAVEINDNRKKMIDKKKSVW